MAMANCGLEGAERGESVERRSSGESTSNDEANVRLKVRNRHKHNSVHLKDLRRYKSKLIFYF